MNARHAARELAVLILNESRVLKKTPSKIEIYDLIEQAVRMLNSEVESILSHAKADLMVADDNLFETSLIYNTENIKEKLEKTLELTHRAMELLSYSNKWSLMCTLAMKHEVKDFTVKIIEQYKNKKEEIDQIIQKSTEGWTLDSMYSLDLNAITVATVELMHDEATSYRIIIDEAIEIAKKYGTEDSGRFVNGILTKVLKTMGMGKSESEIANS